MTAMGCDAAGPLCRLVYVMGRRGSQGVPDDRNVMWHRGPGVGDPSEQCTGGHVLDKSTPACTAVLRTGFDVSKHGVRSKNRPQMAPAEILPILMQPLAHCVTFRSVTVRARVTVLNASFWGQRFRRLSLHISRFSGLPNF